jgi:16S rRNA A1518/A1519 N6-dimethyltransferase RsmA/KsgA/DIM1 with predicted DNA glycosylase/AP lyase activity
MELAWNISLVMCALLFFAFTFVVAFGAPFLPTLKDRVPEALELTNLKPGQTILELGSGDGRVLIAAARKGINSVGYELNPLLVVYSKLRAIKYRKYVKIIWGNYWVKQWPKADAIFVFLLQPYMQKLDTKIIQNYPEGIKLVSFAFTIPDKKPKKEIKGLYLYFYPKQLKKKVS